MRAIEWLNRLARKQGVAVRQSYLRVARHARREVGRLMHAGQPRQAERWVRKLRARTGRLVRHRAQARGQARSRRRPRLRP